MKHSLKRQLPGIFIGIMAGTLLCCWLVNTFFLEKYYLKEKEETLLGAYVVLNQGVEQGLMEDEDFISRLELICTTDNISVFVMDTSGKPVLWTNRHYQALQNQLYGYILGVKTQGISEVLEEAEDYRLQETHDQVMGADYIEMVGNLDSGNPFIIRTALESIRDSAAISSQFFAYIGIAAICISSLLIWYLARRISRPVLELTDISRRMTELDFNAKFSARTDNEIALLGQHMNQMSEKLEQTISELKTANNELQKDIERKTQIDEMRKEFLSNVSHELKTPIALIQGYAEGLKECINEDEESRDFYCEVIMDEADKMNTMVKKLLTLNQIEFGNSPVTMEHFDMTALIRNVLASTAILMEQNDIKVIFGAQEPVYVWSDEFQIEEVLTNYISNAIHHCQGDRVIEVKMEQKEQVVRVSVFNTGQPIPEEEMDKIWIKFYKVDKARTREYGGSGIGLSIVKAIMDSINRQCGVQNYSNGVEFWFEVDSQA